MPRTAVNRRTGARAACAMFLALSAPTWPLTGVVAAPATPPSRFGVDAPELARLGVHSVAPLRDRTLVVDLWYPADTPTEAGRVVYKGALPSDAPSVPVAFTVPGIAVRDARATGGGYPLVIVSHGYSNATVAMTWLTENLASKGYVVAAIRHEDPAITDPNGFPEPLLRRPLDLAFIAGELARQLGPQHLIDPTRVALVGYSMGGYGVLTAAGATLDPHGPPMALVPGGLLAPYARGGAEQATIVLPGVRAVVAMSPAGAGRLAAWGADGIKALTVPMLLISGDDDRTVDYRTGARAIFDGATNSHRYLLTFKGAGHAIGLNPVPDSMRQRLWDQDWFEDPVWSKERINEINAHFITAFLDRYVKGDESRAAYLSVATPNAAAGEWPASRPYAYDAYSPGTSDVTVWKGFHRNHATGLELLEARPAPDAR